MSNLENTNNDQSCPTESLIGRVVNNRYRLTEKLGSGGMGVVYKAFDLEDEKEIALKILKHPFVQGEKGGQFWQEAQATALIQHPNVVNAIDIGFTVENCPYIVMELLVGQTLREVISQEAPLDVTRAIVLMLQIAEGVGAAHDLGILHRDLKPTNVFLTRASNAPSKVKILDFSLAKLLRQTNESDMFGYSTGRMLGTPRYMSPEQCDGKKLTPASDVYSLGVILFEMLTNAVPFESPCSQESLLNQTQENKISLSDFVPNLPKELDDFILQVLSNDPEARPRDANQFRFKLKGLAERLNLLRVGELLNLPIEKLMEVGRSSPSGSLVIDAETLRQLQMNQITKEEK